MSFFEFPHTRTYDSDLGWIIKDTHTLDEAVKAIKQWIIDTQPTIDEIQQLYIDIMNGKLPDGLKIGMTKWMEANALGLVGNLVKMVFFELTDDGYFVAYIPDSWNTIQFATTGYDIIISGYDYGHLVLNY